jgi:hypothetical protein
LEGHIAFNQPSKLVYLANSAAFLLNLVFDPEDGGDMFLRNFGLFLKDTALQHSSNQYFLTGCSGPTNTSVL